MEMITASELAELEGCSLRWIQKKARDGSYIYKEELNELNKKVFMFPVADLPRNIKEKYYLNKQVHSDSGFDIKRFTLKEREELDFWMGIVKDWRMERDNSPLSCEEVDEGFCALMKLRYPQYKFSRRILYRKWKYYKDGQYEKMLDNRGKHNNGRTKVTAEIRGAYLYYFLDEARHSKARCYEYMKMDIRREFPEQYDLIPSLRTIERNIDREVDEGRLSKGAIVLGRQGYKAWSDYYSFYIRRETKDLISNEWWVGDTHTLDVISDDGEGKLHRLYLNAWMDVKSGILVGWYITSKPSSQATIYSLRDAILRRDALPDNVYVDNGREFLTHDVGGLGHRARKSQKDKFKAPPIFARLGINMTNAIVKNAKAKVVERRFRDFKEHISRLFPTYTGGNIIERPNILKARIKNGEAIIDAELIDEVNNIIEYYFNYSEYGGSEKEFKGKRRIDVYHENQTIVRRASKNELELMLMRSSRSQKVGRRGIHLDINGERFDYFTEEFRHRFIDKEVYFRYDPDDLSEIRVYDLEDRYIGNLPCDNETVLKYGAGKEQIKAAQKVARRIEKYDRENLGMVRAMGLPAVKDLILEDAFINEQNPAKKADPKIIKWHRAEEVISENNILKDASGFEYEIDTKTMLKNIEIKNKQEE